jgi:hypothetical protein
MAAPKHSPLVGLGASLLLLVWCGVSEACWRWKCGNAGYTYAYPCPAPASPAIGPPAGAATSNLVSPERTGFSAAIRQCPPDMVPVYCDTGSGLWRETSLANAVGCIHFSLVNTPCPGADKKGPGKDPEKKAKDGDPRGQLVPMVHDQETHKFRRSNPGEKPHAYLPAYYLGKPSHPPKS